MSSSNVTLWQTGDPLSPSVLNSKLSPILADLVGVTQGFSVRSFGAVGNGIIDDTNAILACIAAASVSLNTVFFPAGDYLVSGSGAAIFLITRAISIIGENTTSSRIIVASGVVSSTDVFRYRATSSGELRDFRIAGLTIAPQSGTPARYGIALESAANVVAGWLIERMRIDQLGTGTICLDNTAALTDGIFTGTIRDSFLIGGITLIMAGDSIRVIENTITGSGIGISGNFENGARNFVFAFNNCTPNGGVIDFTGSGDNQAYSPLIFGNTMEAVAGGNYPSVPLIRLRGASGGDANLLYEPMIFANSINADLVTNTDAIWLDYVYNAMIGPQEIYSGGTGVGVRTTANTQSLWVDVEGMSWGGAALAADHQVVDPSGTCQFPVYGALAFPPDFNAIPVGSTNLCLWSDALDQSPWGASGASCTPRSLTAPDGTLTGNTITRVSSAADNWQQSIVALTGNGTKTVSFYVHPLTSAQANLALYDSTVAAFRHQVSVTWPSGVPTLTHVSGAGRLFTVEPADYGWARVAFSANSSIATNNNTVVIFPSPSGSNGDTVGIWRVQAEDRPIPFGAIQTGPFRVWSSGAAQQPALPNVRSVTSNYTVLPQDYLVSVNSSSTVTVTLPLPSTATGQIFVVKRMGTGTVVTNSASTASIDGSVAISLLTQYASARYESYGTGYAST